MKETAARIEPHALLSAFRWMTTAKAMTAIFEENFKLVSKYVHATSRGHEAIQIAMGMQLLPQDFISPYYRDDAMLLAMGLTPYDLMLQLMAKKDDPFSGGRAYYCHPALNVPDKPKIIHQSSATGMQAIPATGIAMGLRYKVQLHLTDGKQEEKPVVVCSLGDAAVTEGEVSEAFQMAALRQLPILFLVQDNEWDISAKKEETRAMTAAEFVSGFIGIETASIAGHDFLQCYQSVAEALRIVREERRPYLLHAAVPLLNHHTSGVRKEWYRDDLDLHSRRDPLPFFKDQLIDIGVSEEDLNNMEREAVEIVSGDFEKAKLASDPGPEDLHKFIFAETPVIDETGLRRPEGGKETIMVDCGLHAIEELMTLHPECLLYGQDVGRRLGGVFRETATLAEKFGDERVFNTPIQEAFIIGSTVGLSAVGLKPIVEVQFADYIWPGLNQLFTEVSRSYYLSNGKWPVSMILRVPTGAYGGGGPYHSSSVESVISNILGLKIAYPSNGADLKGLLKAAYYDPNPVVIFEHKGLYWSKLPGTDFARCIEPDSNYILPFGKGLRIVQPDPYHIKRGESILIVTYGMGVHWALQAARSFHGKVEIIDIRTLVPLDETLIFESVLKHGKCLVITEEPELNTFCQSLTGKIHQNCFEWLDAPVMLTGSENVPAIPLNETLENAALPSVDKVIRAIEKILKY